MVSLSTFCTEQVRRLAYFAHAVRSTMATVLLLGLASASISAPSLTSHDAAMPSPEVISGATISAMRAQSAPAPTKAPTIDAISSAQGGKHALVLAVPDTYLMSFDGGRLDTYIANLNRALRDSRSDYYVTVVPFQATDASSQLALLKPDFVLAQSSLIISVAGKEGTPAYSVATRKVPEAKDASQSVGGLILVPANRKDIQKLEDLKGKEVVTTMPLAAGWLAVLGEVAKLNEDPEHFFKKTRFLNMALPNVFSALASGHTDAAVLETCTIERLARERLIAFEDFRVLNDQRDGKLNCARSTGLYPDATLYAFEWTDEQAVRAMLRVLLSAKETDFGE